MSELVCSQLLQYTVEIWGGAINKSCNIFSCGLWPFFTQMVLLYLLKADEQDLLLDELKQEYKNTCCGCQESSLMMLLVFPDQAQDAHAQLSLTHGPGPCMQEIKQHLAFHSMTSHIKLSGYPRQSRHILYYYKRTYLTFVCCGLYLLHSATSLVVLCVVIWDCTMICQSRSFEFIAFVFLSHSIKVISPTDHLWSVLSTLVFGELLG